MDQFLLVLVSGLASGAVYGLMGLGLVIIYRATDVVNFALASLATIGLYAALTLYDRGLPLILAAGAAIVVTAAVGLAARETVIRPLAHGELLSALVMTMAVSSSRRASSARSGATSHSSSRAWWTGPSRSATRRFRRRAC
ncbi:hypothetical protein ACFQ0Q_39875 [Streptomyces aureus]